MRRRLTVLLSGALALGVVAPVGSAQLGLGAPTAARADEPTITTQVINSFDGTPIYSTFFLPAGASDGAKVPVVLEGHGWGGSGETEVAGRIARLLAEGYAVMTWDARGFGKSGGAASTNSPDFERRDASALIDWVARHPAVRLERPGDPVVGMTGPSYGGGIQLVTAAFDPRVDALAPEITWNDLRRALYPQGIPKLGWLAPLLAIGHTSVTGGLVPGSPTGTQTGGLDPALYQSLVDTIDDNTLSPEMTQWYGYRSLATRYGGQGRPAVPTLLMQGSVDTLFDINEAVANLETVQATGAPARLMVFCGGLDEDATTHGVCPKTYAAANDRQHLDDAIVRWFDRFLKGERHRVGPVVEYRTNEGVWRTLSSWPVAGAKGVRTITGGVQGTAVSTGVPTGGPAVLATPSLPGDPSAVTGEIAVAGEQGLEIVGTPKLTLTVEGTGTGAFLFVKLVDRETGEVLNSQETPIRLDSLEQQTISVDLVGLAYTLPAGHHLDLQVATSSAQFAPYRGAGVVTVDASVQVPVR